MIRGREVSRIEGFSDAVFGFTLTLLIVSVEVPETFADLRLILAEFPSFAVTFTVICWVWYEHYLFFRHYALEDGLTVALNSVLLFIVLFYAYPLKFIFTRLVTGWIFGVGPGIDGGATAADGRLLMAVYSGGFVALFAVFMLLYGHAWRRRDALGLSAIERYDTRATAGRHAINVTLGLVSLLITLVLPIDYLAYAGLIFFLMGPAHGTYGYVNGVRRARAVAAATAGEGTKNDERRTGLAGD